ncbi:MAG: heavy metal-binding domain-containing protein [Xenococcaceae cyanobacterium MO_167.B52]|nr:heavy metal-binding domain-containing protein [Xenococcaceae cyanobacterium MO_167.B52]
MVSRSSGEYTPNNNSIILTTLEGVPGKEIIEHYGLVQGSTIRAKHLGKDILAGCDYSQR